MGTSDTFRRAAVIVAKAIAWLAGAIVLLLAVSIWQDAQKEKERQARLNAMLKPTAQHWQIVNATKSADPAVWAINTEDGTLMFCVATEVGQPSCQTALR